MGTPRQTKLGHTGARQEMRSNISKTPTQGASNEKKWLWEKGSRFLRIISFVLEKAAVRGHFFENKEFYEGLSGEVELAAS